jgi:hypothetical protein
MDINALRTAASAAVTPLAYGALFYGEVKIFELINHYDTRPTPLEAFTHMKVVTIGVTAFISLASIYGAYRRAIIDADVNTGNITMDETVNLEADVRDKQGAMVMVLLVVFALIAGIATE